MNIGVIGAGAIATFLLKEINKKQTNDFQIKSVFVRDKEKYRSLEEEFAVTLYTDLGIFLESGIDIVVEAANIEAVKELLPAVMEKKDVILISIGALADEQFLGKINAVAETSKHAVHLPSGAVGGLDLLQNAHAMGTVNEVSLTTRRPAHSLIEESVDQDVVIFDGKAADAIKKFPKNINVSIVLSLAGLGIESTKVQIIADPHIERNQHHVDIKGDFGEASITISNNPLPENPKTSYLAAMSILGTLKRLGANIHIGS